MPLRRKSVVQMRVSTYHWFSWLCMLSWDHPSIAALCHWEKLRNPKRNYFPERKWFELFWLRKVIYPVLFRYLIFFDDIDWLKSPSWLTARHQLINLFHCIIERKETTSSHLLHYTEWSTPVHYLKEQVEVFNFPFFPFILSFLIFFFSSIFCSQSFLSIIRLFLSPFNPLLILFHNHSVFSLLSLCHFSFHLY